MDVQFINSLVANTTSVLEDVVRVESEDIETSVQQGASTFEGNGVVLRVEGDIEGQIIFDFSKELFSQIALAMAGETDLWSMADTKEEYVELLKSVVLEFGNLINGRIISTMHTHNYDCKSFPDYAYYENYSILAQKNITVIVVEAMTKFGSYKIYITNKKEKFHENIVVLAFNIFEEIISTIVNKYIPKGFFFLRNNDIDVTNRLLAEKNVGYLLINIDNLDDPVGIIGSFVKRRPSAKVIIFSSVEKYTMFHGNPNLNIIGYIDNKLPTDAILTNLEHFFEETGIRKSERRQHVRVKVSLMDNARINFSYQNQNIKGDIINIGLGGLMFALDKNINVNKFNFGEKLDNLKIILSDTTIKVEGTVRSFRDNQVNIEFTDLSEENQNIISQYISERYSGDSFI